MPDPTPTPAPARARTRWWFRLIRALLNLALLGLLGLQLFALFVLSSDKHLRLPDFAQHALEEQLQEQGLSVKFSSLELSPSGSLMLLDPKVYLAGTTEPVAEAEYVFVEPDWLTLLWNRRLSFSKVRFGNATLYCPPESSPTGTREPFLTHFGAGLESQGNRWWRLDFLRGYFLDVRLAARGTFTLPAVAAPAVTPQPQPPSPPRPPPRPAPSGASLGAQYRQWAHTMIGWKSKLNGVEKPGVDVVVSGDNSGVNRLEIAAQAESARPSASDVELAQPRIRLAASWDGNTLRALGPARAGVESVRYAPTAKDAGAPGAVSSGPAWAFLQLAEGRDGIFSGWPSRAVLHALDVQAGDFSVDSIESNLDLRGWPQLPFSAKVTHGGDSLSFSGKTAFTEGGGGLAWQGGEISGRGRVSLATLLATAHEQLPDRLKGLALDTPLALDGSAVITPAGELQTADVKVHAGGVHFEKINLASLNARARVSRDAAGSLILNITQAEFVNPAWRVTGSYFQNLATDDFLLHVRGDVEPGVLDGYFEKWWEFVWNFVTPDGQWPRADVVYAGNWDGPDAQNSILVCAEVAHAKAQGIPMDSIFVRVEQRPEILAVYDLTGQATGGGQLKGGIYWTMKPPYEHVYEERLIFDSTLPLPAVAAIGGPDAAVVVKPIESAVAPTIHLDQRTGGLANPQPDVTVTKVHAEFSSPLRVFHVPLDNGAVDATAYEGFTDIPHLEFGIAGGTAAANATVTAIGGGDVLRFSVLLQNARHTDFLSALGQFNSDENNTTPAPGTAANAKAPATSSEAMLGDPAHPGRLDLALGGELTLGKPETFEAEGKARLRDAQLGKLQLLGGLSRLLEDTKVPLGAFTLTDATSDVEIARSYLRLPNLIVTGPSARIVAAGIYHFDDSTLDFNALIFPVAEWDSMVLKQIASILNPFSNTVTLKLHEKITDPQWSLSMNPLRLFEDRTVEGPPIPGMPADAKGAPLFSGLPPAPALPDLPKSGK